jgi:hypothetical protein
MGKVYQAGQSWTGRGEVHGNSGRNQEGKCEKTAEPQLRLHTRVKYKLQMRK